MIFFVKYNLRKFSFSFVTEDAESQPKPGLVFLLVYAGFPRIFVRDNRDHKTALISPQIYGKKFYCMIAINKKTRCANILLKNAHALGKMKVSAVCQPENQLPIAKTTFLYEKLYGSIVAIIININSNI